MASFCKNLVRLLMPMGLYMTWVVILTYMMIILPVAEIDFHEKLIFGAIFAFFSFMQQYNYWYVFLSDPGYVSTHYKFENFEGTNDAENLQQYEVLNTETICASVISKQYSSTWP